MKKPPTLILWVILITGFAMILGASFVEYNLYRTLITCAGAFMIGIASRYIYPVNIYG